MKKVVSGLELENKMKEAIKLLCGTVKTTLGPKGRNVIIDHSSFSPFITNDGVTIAENIESEDAVTNTILELAKEAAIKTNEKVGDGTTTTLVLLESLFLNGIARVRDGYSPIILKQELDQAIKEVIDLLKKESKRPNLKEIQNIASISANDEKIGLILKQAYQKVGANGIILKEQESENTNVTYLKGYFIETLIASPYFFKDQASLVYQNPLILITNNELNDIEEISLIINETIQRNHCLLVIAKDYSDCFINDILSFVYTKQANIALLRIPGYGLEAHDILSDLEVIADAKIITNFDDITIDSLGEAESITITKEETQIIFASRKEIKKYVDKIFISDNKRLAMLKEGIAQINIGAPTTTERREKKMRFDDALCAIKSASKGVLPGGGLIYYKISEELASKNEGMELLKVALKAPLKQILLNAALDSEDIINKIKEQNYQVLYNVKNNCYEGRKVTSVIDTLEVLSSSLKNASSIAGMLLTTSHLVINEYQTKEITNYPE